MNHRHAQTHTVDIVTNHKPDTKVFTFLLKVDTVVTDKRDKIKYTQNLVYS